MKESAARGFEAFVNEEILKVDTSTINVVRFICKSGKVVSIEAEWSFLGFPIISVIDSSEQN